MKQTIESSDPSNGEVLGEVQRASRVTILEVVERAKKAGAQWRRVSLENRLTSIENAYSSVESSVDRLSELLSKEMGKDHRRGTGNFHRYGW
jgi:aldehyde dehydrogenase (NAD+)/succinate-semialdehyde dehydrogenase/glutarate-semialdehyde dehydrogenase